MFRQPVATLIFTFGTIAYGLKCFEGPTSKYVSCSHFGSNPNVCYLKRVVDKPPMMGQPSGNNLQGDKPRLRRMDDRVLQDARSTTTQAIKEERRIVRGCKKVQELDLSPTNIKALSSSQFSKDLELFTGLSLELRLSREDDKNIEVCACASDLCNADPRQQSAASSAAGSINITAADLAEAVTKAVTNAFSSPSAGDVELVASSSVGNGDKQVLVGSAFSSPLASPGNFSTGGPALMSVFWLAACVLTHYVI